MGSKSHLGNLPPGFKAQYKTNTCISTGCLTGEADGGNGERMKHAIAGRVMKPVGQDIATAVTSNGRVCQKSVFFKLYLSARALLNRLRAQPVFIVSVWE